MRSAPLNVLVRRQFPVSYCKAIIMAIWVSILLALAAFETINGQRLSQGASDWYMRFHSNFEFVKRNVERPVTKSFLVNSDIKHRYAVTKVVTVVYNPANVEQTYNFGFVMPDKALVSNATIIRARVASLEDNQSPVGNVEVVKGVVNASSFMVKVQNDEKEEKIPHERLDQASFSQFVLPIKLGPLDEATISLVFEYLLERKQDAYQHVISLSPGEIVKNFQVKLSIKDDNPLNWFNVTAPVIGTVAQGESIVADKNPYQIAFNMSELEQFHYFGTHGFTGDLKIEFGIELPKDKLDVAMQGSHFAHFYNGPSEELESIPSHVIFLFDLSSSMSGDKLNTAKQVFSSLIQSMTERDYFNLALFNGKYGDFPRDWHPVAENFEQIYNKEQHLMEAFPCTESNVKAVLDLMSTLENDRSSNLTTNYLANAFEHIVQLSKQIWVADAMPENVVSRIIILTDGGKPGTDNNDINSAILRSNMSPKMPIMAIGIGFEANMELLENIAVNYGDLAENIIEDVQVEDQLEAIRKHMQDVILKNVQLRYLGENGEAIGNLTKSHFRFFSRGSSAVVAGQVGKLQKLSTIEITAQSSEGEYTKRIPFVAGPQHLGCKAEATLCTQPGFEGQCVTLVDSHTKLVKLNLFKKAESVKIGGTCAWLMCTKANFKGHNVILLPGNYEVLPGNLYKNIASLKVTENVVSNTKEMAKNKKYPIQRLWAYLKVQNSIKAKTLEPLEVQSAYVAAMKQNFLTPYTDIHLEDDASETSIVENRVVTYDDLSPVFFEVDDPDYDKQLEALMECQKPIQCKDNFHYEIRQEQLQALQSTSQTEEQPCSGSLSVFTRPFFEGDGLVVEDSLKQIYHSINGQRMRSLVSNGNCCWLLFNHRRFAGNVDKICGDAELPLRKSSIGSIKKIGQQPPDTP